MTVAMPPDSELALLQALWACSSEQSGSGDPRFERIARLAATLFDVPIVLVTLADVEGRSRSTVLGANVRGGERFRSLCSRIAHGEEAQVIEDTALDERLEGVAEVSGPLAVRFAASSPVRSRTGQCVGAFSILDRFPRRFDSAQVKLLDEVAAIVEDLLSADEAARRDQATGAFTRDTFLELGGHSLAYARTRRLPAALVVLQPRVLLRELSERHADWVYEVMAEVADTVQSASRTTDLVGRISENRVGILMFGSTEESARRGLSRIESLLRARWEDAFGAEVLGIQSVLIAGLDESTDSVASALKDAEQWIGDMLDSEPVH